MRFSDVEISQLTKAWLAISLAFAIAWRSTQIPFWNLYLIAALTVGLAFLFHEIAHKYYAQRYGCWAEFRSFDIGLLMAVAMSFFGFIFAAPGAVVISGIVSQEDYGKIAVAGPVTNIILAVVFWFLATFAIDYLTFLPVDIFLLVQLFFQIGISINSWLAFFNLLPLGS